MLSDAIRAAVAASPLTPHALAVYAGLSPPQVYRALREGATIREPTATRLLTALGLEVRLVPVGAP